MNVKPIRSEDDYDQALQRIEALWGSPVGSVRGDELEVLVTLVEAYEREHYPIDLPNPLDAIKFRLEQSGKDVLDLVGIIGQRTRVYEVMRGDRPLSLRMIRNLHRELGIPAEVLIQAARRPHTEKRRLRSAAKRSLSPKRQVKGRERSVAELKRLSGRGDARGWRFDRDEIHDRSQR